MCGQADVIIHDSVPNYHPVSKAWIHWWPHNSTERSFNSHATWVIDWLFCWHVIHGCLYNQALADVRSTGSGITCLYCKVSCFRFTRIVMSILFYRSSMYLCHSCSDVYTMLWKKVFFLVLSLIVSVRFATWPQWYELALAKLLKSHYSKVNVCKKYFWMDGVHVYINIYNHSFPIPFRNQT